MTTALIVLGAIFLLTLVFVLWPTKVRKREIDFNQIINDIDESINSDELVLIRPAIEDYIEKYWGNYGKQKPEIIRTSLSQKAGELFQKEYTPIFNIHEPSK